MTKSPSAPVAVRGCPCGSPPAEPLARLLDELAGVIAGLSDGQYVRHPVGVIPGSVGAHVRHCLDHVAALRLARETGQLDYDHRERGTPVETDRAAALDAVRDHAAALLDWTAADLSAGVRLWVMLTADGDPMEVGTTLGRELAYAVSHTIHHNAILGAMVRTLGGSPPERFGYAPSTLRHADAQRKAG